MHISQHQGAKCDLQPASRIAQITGMKKLLLATMLVWLPELHAADETTPKPGFLGRMWRSTKEGAGRAWSTTRDIGGKTMNAAKSPFHRNQPRDVGTGTGWRRLAMTMVLEPSVVKVGETRVIEVTVGVVNKGKDPVQLDFPDSQRIDVLVQDESGRVLSRWSDDQRLDKEAGFLLINPGEKVEYHARISTREMTAGRSHTINAVFPKYDRLHTSRTVVPVR